VLCIKKGKVKGGNVGLPQYDRKIQKSGTSVLCLRLFGAENGWSKILIESLSKSWLKKELKEETSHIMGGIRTIVGKGGDPIDQLNKTNKNKEGKWHCKTWLKEGSERG